MGSPQKPVVILLYFFFFLHKWAYIQPLYVFGAPLQVTRRDRPHALKRLHRILTLICPFIHSFARSVQWQLLHARQGHTAREAALRF